MSDDQRDEGNDEPPKIKVTDRRLFDREGNPRPEAESERAAQPERPPETVGESDRQAPPPATPPTPPPPAPAGEDDAADRQRPAAATEPSLPDEEGGPLGLPGAEGPSGPADLPRDFASFVESQYYETLLYLGAMRHPATGQVMEDLDMAQYKIDLLSMIQEKTEGNRTPEESKLLEDVLYQLRMGYLQKRKVAKL